MKIILMDKNNSKGGFISNLGLCSFGVICISNSQMQASIIILTIKCGTSIIQIPNVTTINLKPIVVVLFYVISFMQCMTIDVCDCQHKTLQKWSTTSGFNNPRHG